jgi:moderate conductance mechanosensitive channel
MPEFLRETFGLTYAPVWLPLIRIAGTIFLAILLLKLIDSALKRLRLLIPSSDLIGITRAEQRAETLRQIIHSVTKFVLIIFVFLQATSELGFDTTSILATVSIVGVAVGFGAQSLVKDVLSGFFILLEDQYGVGDVIKVGDHSGVVERMTLRATVLRNLEGQVHVIPNGNIQTVTVLTKEWARAVVDITVSYRENVEAVFRVLQKIGDRLHEDWPDRVTEKPSILGIEQLGAEGITIRCVTKTPPMKQWDVMREWRKRIKEEFERQGIELPLPPRTLVIQPGETTEKV